MKITEARDIIASIALEKRSVLQSKEIEALSLADQALKTIEDMKTKGASLYGTQCTL